MCVCGSRTEATSHSQKPHTHKPEVLFRSRFILLFELYFFFIYLLFWAVLCCAVKWCGSSAHTPNKMTNKKRTKKTIGYFVTIHSGLSTIAERPTKQHLASARRKRTPRYILLLWNERGHQFRLNAVNTFVRYICVYTHAHSSHMHAF